MPIHSSRVRSLAIAGVAIGAAGLGLLAAGPANFKPDGTFTGSTLAGWHVVGDATWKAQNGELVGTAKPGTSGGWLVMDKSFQDVQLYANYRCTGDCKSGVLLRAQKTPDGGMTGVFVSLTEGDTGVYSVTLDSSGKETARDQITAPGRGGGGRRGAAAGGGAGGRAASEPAPVPAAGGRQAAPAPRGTQQGSAGRRGPMLQANEWNEEYITIGQEGPTANSTERRNEVVSTFAGTIPLDEPHAGGYGPVALYVGGAGEVHYKDLAWKDLMHVVEPKEVVSSHYTIQRLNPLYYGWGAATADVNHDGTLDVISGPFYYLGPSFTERRIYREGVIYNPENSFAPDMVNLAADFTGDGWPDILSSLGNRHMDLYVNPKGESRRWEKYSVLPTISSEIVLLKDLDKDGKPEVIFGQGAAGGYAWAHPDPANPTAVWTPHVISSPGQAVNGHGIGVGDVNGDGRLDIVVPTGWYEQPAGGIATSPWTFHEAELGDPRVFGSGGGEMGVYDVNGDGLPDIVAGSAHNWGFDWYEQKKDGTFVRHQIMKDFSTASTNTAGVVFSELHGERYADMDGDGIPDVITGKRYWSEAGNNTLTHNDPFGAPVLYIYKTVRDPKAPGGARFVPELVHNMSGVGSSFDVVDLNKDGKPDIVTSTVFGTFVFESKPGAAPSATPKK
jgi:3-keto-disaccharide hydrolase/FG-GAP-like repeat